MVLLQQRGVGGWRKREREAGKGELAERKRKRRRERKNERRRRRKKKTCRQSKGSYIRTARQVKRGRGRKTGEREKGRRGRRKKVALFSLSLSFSPIPPPPFSLARPALFRRHRKTRDDEPAKSKFSKSEATGEFFRFFLNIFLQ